MKVIDEISDKGGKMLLFESFVGSVAVRIPIVGIINSLGLPCNVVLAARGTAKFIQEGTYKYYPIAIYLEEQNFSGRLWSL
jgi:hypothetical protein